MVNEHEVESKAEQAYYEVPITQKVMTTPENATEMVSLILAACLALWANKTGKMDEFAAWMAEPERKNMLLMGCSDPEHDEPHYPFQKQLDGDMADQFLYYFVNHALPQIKFVHDVDLNEPLTGPYL